MYLEQLFPLFQDAENKLEFVRERQLQREADLKRKEQDEAEAQAKKQKTGGRRKRTKADQIQLTPEQMALMNELGLTKAQIMKLKDRQ